MKLGYTNKERYGDEDTLTPISDESYEDKERFPTVELFKKDGNDFKAGETYTATVSFKVKSVTETTTNDKEKYSCDLELTDLSDIKSTSKKPKDSSGYDKQKKVKPNFAFGKDKENE